MVPHIICDDSVVGFPVSIYIPSSIGVVPRLSHTQLIVTSNSKVHCYMGHPSGEKVPGSSGPICAEPCSNGAFFNIEIIQGMVARQPIASG